MRKTVLDFEDGDGLFTLGVKDKQEALTMMREWWDDDPEWHSEKFLTPRFEEGELETDRAYLHRLCHYYTIGDNWCGECGEHSTGSGTLTYLLRFKRNPSYKSPHLRLPQYLDSPEPINAARDI